MTQNGSCRKARHAATPSNQLIEAASSPLCYDQESKTRTGLILTRMLLLEQAGEYLEQAERTAAALQIPPVHCELQLPKSFSLFACALPNIKER